MVSAVTASLPKRFSFNHPEKPSGVAMVLDLKESTGRLALWRLRLMEFSFEIVHCPRLSHQAADAMSRQPKVDQEAVDEAKVVDNDIPTYCKLGQQSDTLCETKES